MPSPNPRAALVAALVAVLAAAACLAAAAAPAAALRAQDAPAQQARHYVLAELRDRIERRAAPAAGRAFETTTVTKTDDCGSTTTTHSRFTNGGAGPAGCAQKKVFKSEVTGGGAAARPVPVLPAGEPKAATQADGEEFAATKTLADSGCGDKERCKDKRSVVNAGAAVSKIGEWLRNFRRNNRVDPRSVAEEIMAPMVQSLKRRNEATVKAIAEDQDLQRENLREELAEHGYNQLREEMRNPTKIKPQPADSRSLFEKMHSILTGADEKQKEEEKAAAGAAKQEKTEA